METTASSRPAADVTAPRECAGKQQHGREMKTAFLRLVGLPPTDHKQIEVFLRFTGRTDGFQWIATAGDLCDLQLESLPADGTISTPLMSSSGEQSLRGWILDRGQAPPDSESYVLRRPLQIDGFEALLRTRELQLARISTALQATAAVRHAPTKTSAAPFVDDPRCTYRLTRWPAADLLRGKPKYVRMLGFLSNRPLTLARLTMLSGVDEAGCCDLLHMLDQRGLLVRGESEPDNAPSLFADTVPEGLAAAAVANARPAREAASAGLFSRLRKRLGLT